jgi:hypothetical protein
MKLRIYAIFVTVVLVAVLINPSAERHYEKLAQFYPWVNESRLADARMEVWSLSPPSEREKLLPYDSLTNDGYDLRLIYTSWGLLSFVQCDERYPPCGNDGGPSKPISLGVLGFVFAKRPPTPEEYEKQRQRQLDKDRLPRLQTRSGQAKAYKFSGEGSLNAPDGSGTNAASFRIQSIRGPKLIEMPPRPKDALYKMESLE